MYDVVLVDDAPAAKRSLRSIIETDDVPFRVVGEAVDGREALDLMAQSMPHLLFVDVRMPTMDGLELSRVIRERRWPVEIIIVSGYGQFEYAQKAIQYEVTDYLLKPVDPDEVRRLLGEVHGRLESREASLLEHIRRSFDEGLRFSHFVDAIWEGHREAAGAHVDEIHDVFAGGELRSVLSQVYQHLAAQIEARLSARTDDAIGFPTRPQFHRNQRKLYLDWRRYVDELMDAVAAARDSRHRGPVAECVEYLRTHFGDKNITLLSLAERAGLSPSYFSRRFKEEVGRPYGEFLSTLRLEEAGKLLRDRKLLVYQVAEQVGYGDYAHFERTFHRRFGVSPTEYRENPHHTTWNDNSRHTDTAD